MLRLIKIEDNLLNNKNPGENKIKNDETSLVQVSLANGRLKNQECKELLLRIGADQLEESEVVKILQGVNVGLQYQRVKYSTNYYKYE